MKRLSELTEQELITLSYKAMRDSDYGLLVDIDEYLVPLQEKKLLNQIKKFLSRSNFPKNKPKGT